MATNTKTVPQLAKELRMRISEIRAAVTMSGARASNIINSEPGYIESEAAKIKAVAKAAATAKALAETSTGPKRDRKGPPQSLGRLKDMIDGCVAMSNADSMTWGGVDQLYQDKFERSIEDDLAHLTSLEASKPYSHRARFARNMGGARSTIIQLVMESLKNAGKKFATR